MRRAVAVPREPAKYGRFWFKLFVAVCSVALVAALVLIVALAGARGGDPVIDSMEPAIAEPGAIVTLKGGNFGAERGNSRVELAGVAATQSAYRSWTDTEIVVRLPSGVDSGLLRVITTAAPSNGAIFMAKKALPTLSIGSTGAAGGPFIETVTPDSSAIGSLVTIKGRDFGANRGKGEVFFSWLSELGSGERDVSTTQGVVSGYESEISITAWSDREIKVFVPDGSVSGSIFVSNSKGRSNSIPFSVSDQPGRKTYRGRATFAVSYFVSINDVKATGPNDVYLWIPRPIENAWQREVRPLSVVPEPYVGNLKGLSVFRLKDLMPGRETRAELRYLVHTYAVETTIDPARIKVLGEPTGYMANFLKKDQFVPSDDPAIVTMAKTVVGGEKNPYRVAKYLFDWLSYNVTPGLEESSDPGETLRSRRGSSYGMAALYCAMLRASGVPAIPVSGYLVSPFRAAIGHCWVEFYLYGLGWIPADPALGTGKTFSAFNPAYSDPRKYFGNIDNKRMAFSRGYLDLSPMVPGGMLGRKDRKHSIQSLYEQSVGLSSYTSFWSDIEISY